MEGKPLFKENNTSFFREEKDGFWTLIPRRHPEVRELIINRTSKQILDLCNGDRTISEIQKEMQRIYPKVKAHIIEKDVKMTIAQHSRLTLLEWNGENPFLIRLDEPLNDEYCARIGQEDDLLEILKFLQNKLYISNSNYIIYFSPLISDLDYSEILLRQKLFSFYEEFFLLYKNNRLEGIVSISMSNKPKMSAMVCIIITPKQIALNHLSYAISTFPMVSVADITKISVYDDANAKIDLQLENLLYDEMFYLEARIKNELGFGKDLRVFSHFYDEEKMHLIHKIKTVEK